MGDVEKILSITFAGLVLAWVITDSAGFSAIANASSAAIVGSVKALQGR